MQVTCEALRIITDRCPVGIGFRTDIAVQNELIKAINELRDEFSTQNYGKKFGNLTQEQQKIVKEAVPQSISEAEPKDTGKK